MPDNYELLVDLLRDVNRGISNYVKEILAKRDIPVAMGMIARHIGIAPGITVSELARRTGIAKSHVSKIIKDLEERGWVEKRESAEDQRLLLLYLTPSGHKSMSDARLEVRRSMNNLVADLTPEQVEVLSAGLTQIKDALKGRERIDHD